ncbi:MAG: DUF1292 domain-containing protein [Anaerovibrio sp.]|nr:DUF1292 domain-containing protein [Anaerovibrio sp.]
MSEEILDDENIVVEFKDEAGNSLYYQQEMIIPVNGMDFALLIGLNVENDEAFEEEENVIIAKIVKDENGEDEYVDPTDEEFDAVQAVYEEMCDAEESE